MTALCDVLLFWDELFYYESFGLFAVPVSYTHLDVYKRQGGRGGLHHKARCDRGLAAKNQSHVRHAGTSKRTSFKENKEILSPFTGSTFTLFSWPLKDSGDLRRIV